MSFLDKARAVLRGFGYAAAAVLILPVCGLVLGLVLTFVVAGLNRLVDWPHLGELQAWLGVILALYGFYASLVIAPIIWWRVSAKRLSISRRATNVGTIAVSLLFGAVGLVVFLGEQATTNNMRLEAVADDGKLVIARYSYPDSSVLYKIDATTGRNERLTRLPRGFESDAALSPDGKLVVFTYSAAGRLRSLMLTDLAAGNTHELQSESGDASWPRFSGDGTTVYFCRQSFDGHESTVNVFSTPLNGARVTQLTDQTLTFDNYHQLNAAPVLSSDGKMLLFTTDRSLLLFALTRPQAKAENVLFELPKAPPSRQNVAAYFSPDDHGLIFMSATQGKDAYDYDLYHLDLESSKIQKLTSNNGYASDFRLAPRGQKGVFLRWKFSPIQKLPRSFQLQLMDMQSGRVVPVEVSGLPR